MSHPSEVVLNPMEGQDWINRETGDVWVYRNNEWKKDECCVVRSGWGYGATGPMGPTGPLSDEEMETAVKGWLVSGCVLWMLNKCQNNK